MAPSVDRVPDTSRLNGGIGWEGGVVQGGGGGGEEGLLIALMS